MFTVFWFIIVLFISTYSIVWLIDNNGDVMVNWLGYQMQTDVLTTVLITIFFTILIIVLASLLTRILAIKFPSLLRFFFKRNYTKSLEKIVLRHQHGFDDLSSLLLAIELKDQKYINLHQKNFSAKIKNKKLNNFIKGKIALSRDDQQNVIHYFSQFSGNNHANILTYNAKFNLAIESSQESKAIAYGKQLCRLDKNRIDVAKKLIILCRKNGLWHDLHELQAIFKDKISEYIDPEDLSNIALFLAKGFYQQKKYLKAQISARKALKFNSNSVNAQEMLLKSWIKLGFRFYVTKKTKKIFSKTPSLKLARIYLFNYKKSSTKRQIKLLIKLLNKNPNFELNNFILAKFYYSVGDNDKAIELLNSIAQDQLNDKIKARIIWLKNKINNHQK
ncbi:hypothetical protein LBMAG18_07240 [Alphaproteobacteria bacterium]|nr:hypothetical protein LBMAG18_07240 [Alphaproteobacteria bacterium]